MNKYGCGLGLSISKILSQALDGDLTISSMKGSGTKCVLYLKDLTNN